MSKIAIKDLDANYFELIDNTDELTRKNIAKTIRGGFDVSFNGPIGVLFIGAVEEKATGTIAINRAEVNFSFENTNFNF